MMLGLLVLGLVMPWRVMAFFMVLLGCLTCIDKLPRTVWQLQGFLVVFLYTGIVLFARDAPRGLLSDAGRIGIFLLLIAGVLGVCWILLYRGQKRPIGGIVDLLVLAGCLLFPLMVLWLQYRARLGYENFPIQVSVHSLALSLLAVLVVYFILSQLVVQQRGLLSGYRPLWRIALVGLGIILLGRMGMLGINMIQVRQAGYSPGEDLERLIARAVILDSKMALESVAFRVARQALESGRAEDIHRISAPVLAFQPETEEGRRRLRKRLRRDDLSLLLMGSSPVRKSAPVFSAFCLDEKRGRFFLADRDGGLFVFASRGLRRLEHDALQEMQKPIRSMLWWERDNSLWLLYQNGALLSLRMQHFDTRPEDPLEISSAERLMLKKSKPVRVLAGIPSAGCIVAGYGDFELEPVLGALPETIRQSVFRPGQNILRDVCFLESGTGGYLLDAFGGIHPIGDTPINYQDLKDHARQEYHYWAGSDVGRAVFCSLDGRRIAVFDAYGGIHGIEKLSGVEHLNYFGSVQAYHEEPVIAGVVAAYDSYYLLHQSGQIERRTGAEHLFELFHPQEDKSSSSLPIFLSMMVLGGILLCSSRKVPLEAADIQVHGG